MEAPGRRSRQRGRPAEHIEFCHLSVLVKNLLDVVVESSDLPSTDADTCISGEIAVRINQHMVIEELDLGRIILVLDNTIPD